MRLLVQRVTEARVRVEGHIVGEIGRGYLVFVGIATTDSEATARKASERLISMRLMAGDHPFDVPLAPDDGLLLVSQFTLYGNLTKGRRPSFIEAAPPDHARAIYDTLVEAVRATGHPVATGKFQTMMQVELINDGPTTFLVEID